jgi:hypothetical protein
MKLEAEIHRVQDNHETLEKELSGTNTRFSTMEADVYNVLINEVRKYHWQHWHTLMVQTTGRAGNGTHQGTTSPEYHPGTSGTCSEPGDPKSHTGAGISQVAR